MKQGWEYKKLGEVCKIVSGSTPKTNISGYWGEGHYWITPAELNGNVYVDSTNRQITDAALAKTKLHLLPKGTVLLSSRAPIGKVAITTVPMYCNQGFKNCICSEVLFNKYLYYFLVSKNEYLNSLGVGATFKEISKSIVEKVSLPLPPLSEQHAIVAELDKINEIIDLKKEQLKDLDLLALSIFYDMFGDPIENPKGWEVKKLIEVVDESCTISYGIVQPGDGVEDGIPVVRPVDLVNDVVEIKNLKKTTQEISNSYKRSILDGTEILMCVRGTTGIVSYASSELKGCNVTRGIVPIKVGNSTERTFLFQQFRSAALQELIAERTYGATLKQINMKDLRNLPLILPPLSLQQSFAEKIQTIESQKSAIKQSLAEVETLLASRMDFYFN